MLRWTLAGTFKTRFQEAFESLKGHLESGGKSDDIAGVREGQGLKVGRVIFLLNL